MKAEFCEINAAAPTAAVDVAAPAIPRALFAAVRNPAAVSSVLPLPASVTNLENVANYVPLAVVSDLESVEVWLHTPFSIVLLVPPSHRLRC